MISCDTNILFVALEISPPGHELARRFLDAERENADFGLCELSLLELYLLLRNPATARRPLDAGQAVSLIQGLRADSRWDLLDYPGPLAGIIWRIAADPGFARRKVFDARLALTLRHHGVTEFATANFNDFEGFGFEGVWNTLVEKTAA